MNPDKPDFDDDSWESPVDRGPDDDPVDDLVGELGDDPVDDPANMAEETSARVVTSPESGWRLDLYLVHHFPQYSRGLVRKAIQSGCVNIDGRGGKPAYRLKPGQEVTFRLPEIPRESPVPEEIPLNILYEDDSLVVIDKPAGMVVHPSRGHWTGTLVGALAFHFMGKLSTVRGPARPGIVHRLDRDTSGAILVAKNDIAHARLAAQFETKKIRKEYLAIVAGVPALDRDLIDLPIGFHPKHREKMAIRQDDPEAKESQTFYEVLERFHGFSVLRALPRTGRTHQIRLHLAQIDCPVLCDGLYGRQKILTRGEISGQQSDGEILLARQALHAHRLTFEHPFSGEILEIVAPIPEDMNSVVLVLQKWR